MDKVIKIVYILLECRKWCSLFFLKKCSLSGQWKISSSCSKVQARHKHWLYYFSQFGRHVKREQYICGQIEVKFRHYSSWLHIVVWNVSSWTCSSDFYVMYLTGEECGCRSNFLGTKFTIYDSQPPHNGAVASTNRASRRMSMNSKQVSSRIPAGSYNVAHIAYELNVLGTRGPRRMQCTLHTIPATSMDSGGTAPTPTEFTPSVLEDTHIPYSSILSSPRSKAAVADCSTIDCDFHSGVLSKDEPLVLKNKAPRWHEQLQCWCLNFRGRVTVASVKNFQLVAAATEPAPTSTQGDHDKVILQFGKIGKDMFTMDYRYPLSAFQAFAICLSSFDTKLACE